jgi:hypothetical protein
VYVFKELPRFVNGPWYGLSQHVSERLDGRANLTVRLIEMTAEVLDLAKGVAEAGVYVA